MSAISDELVRQVVTSGARQDLWNDAAAKKKGEELFANGTPMRDLSTLFHLASADEMMRSPELIVCPPVLDQLVLIDLIRRVEKLERG